MNITRKYIVFVEMVALLCAVGILFLTLSVNRKVDPTFGSVVVGNDYKSSELTSANASGTTAKLLKTGGGSLGSVVITVPASAGNVVFYNYASTTATSSAATMFSFTAAADVAGTYTFDTEFTTGLSVEVPAGFDGRYTVTYR